MTSISIEEFLSQLGKPGKIRRHPATMASLEYVDAPTGRIAYEVAGAGPSVLIVHGWQGSPRDFSTLMPEFQAIGARTVALDLPAHGASDGETLTAHDAAAAILALAEKEGPFEAVIAHSFGCVATTLALEKGLKIHAAVFFAPPARQEAQLRRLCTRNGLNDEQAQKVVDVARARGVDLIDVVARAAQRTEPLLVMHASDDDMTPMSGARDLAAAWPGAKLLPADGLGHNTILRDKAMIAAALRFALGA